MGVLDNYVDLDCVYVEWLEISRRVYYFFNMYIICCIHISRLRWIHHGYSSCLHKLVDYLEHIFCIEMRIPTIMYAPQRFQIHVGGRSSGYV